MTAIVIGAVLVLIAVILAFPQAKIPSKIMPVLSEGIPMLSFCVPDAPPKKRRAHLRRQGLTVTCVPSETTVITPCSFAV